MGSVLYSVVVLHVPDGESIFDNPLVGSSASRLLPNARWLGEGFRRWCAVVSGIQASGPCPARPLVPSCQLGCLERLDGLFSALVRPTFARRHGSADVFGDSGPPSTPEDPWVDVPGLFGLFRWVSPALSSGEPGRRGGTEVHWARPTSCTPRAMFLTRHLQQRLAVKVPQVFRT